MSTIEINDAFVATGKPIRRRWLRTWFEQRRQRHMQRVTLAELEFMDTHLLRDIGIEPRDVIDAIEGRDRSLLFNPMRRDDT